MAEPFDAHPGEHRTRRGDLISVVVPTKGRPTELRQTLTSIIAQRDVDLEVVVVDDAPDGRTGPVIESLRDPRVRVVDNGCGRRGAGSSRNTGLRHASGRLVAFCDDDDLWSPDKLRAQCDSMAAQGATWSCTGAVLVDPDLRLLGHERPEAHRFDDLRFFNFVPAGGSGILATAAALAAAGPFDETLTNSEDWDMWIRLGRQGRGVVVDRPLVAYRVWPSNKSSNIAAVQRSIHSILGRHSTGPLPGDFAHLWDQYFMRKLTTSGRHRQAARVGLRMAIRRRDPRYLARAAALLVAPGPITQYDRRHRVAAIPAGWRSEAEAWLADLRSSEPDRAAAPGAPPGQAFPPTAAVCPPAGDRTA